MTYEHNSTAYMHAQCVRYIPVYMYSISTYKSLMFTEFIYRKRYVSVFQVIQLFYLLYIK